MEDKLGTIETGKLGDIVVLDRDYRAVADADLPWLQPILTVVGGQVVHDTGDLTHRPLTIWKAVPLDERNRTPWTRPVVDFCKPVPSLEPPRRPGPSSAGATRSPPPAATANRRPAT